MPPRIIVFASGTKDNGGSGFENLVKCTRKYADRPQVPIPNLSAQTRNNAEGLFDYEVVAVVSNHEHGGVRERADRLGIPFIHFDQSQHTDKLEFVGMLYRDVVQRSGAEWVALSGWFKHVQGLDPRHTFNIHPALLSQLGGRFGGKGMYGHREHAAVKDALEKGELNETGVSMHFVTDEYDRGPVFFEYRIPLKRGMTADEIQTAVQVVEYAWQPKITNMVVHGEIGWDGKDPRSLVVPKGYTHLPKTVADYQ